MERIDITGQRFGKLTVIGYAGNNRTAAQWLCRCDCGNECIVVGTKLRSGYTKSCSCAQKIVTSIHFKKHGKTGTPEYRTWKAMKERCYNVHNIGYKNYGARGIRVCERWLNSFENFLSDMGVKPGKKYSIDRKDSTGNYEPGNCKWATMKEQGGNTSRNVWIEYEGQTKIIQDWAIFFKVAPYYIRTCIKNNHSGGVFDSLKQRLDETNNHRAIA